jgi:hypothetical protein
LVDVLENATLTLNEVNPDFFATETTESVVNQVQNTLERLTET